MVAFLSWRDVDRQQVKPVYTRSSSPDIMIDKMTYVFLLINNVEAEALGDESGEWEEEGGRNGKCAKPAGQVPSFRTQLPYQLF